MAVYKIFPKKDATLYSAYPAMNTGVDAILEVSNTYPSINPSPQVARSLIQFNVDDIKNVVDNIVMSNNYSSSLKLYIAEAHGIIQDTTLEVNLVSGNWNNGGGQYLDSPQTTNGVSWDYMLSSGSGAWGIPGGDIQLIPASVSQSFDYRSIKDLNVNVTDGVKTIYATSSRNNDSFLVKLTGSQEFISGSSTQPQLKFYSVDTNTIYPPVLEFKWDDAVYSTTLNDISTSDVFMALDNNPGEFYSESINRFRLNVRPEFPPRTFLTSSLYTLNYALPADTYYAIKDLDTNEYVVDFDINFTKVSCDNTSNYFDIYMNGLEPERYYKILIQTTINGSTIVKDEDYIFKVING